MTLSQWLKLSKTSSAAFAAMVSVHPVTVTKWTTRRMIPRTAKMSAITQATAGAVQPSDFYAAAPTRVAA